MIATITAARSGGDWRRRYPPLLAVLAAIGLAVYTLPSALNLPQANPGQVAEYAPVPGNSNAAPAGNFAGLGLGEGSSQGAPPPPPPPGGTTSGTGVPPNFDCVGNPPRQTADPLSPPCVPSYSGDNGGATWAGVSGKQITVLFHWLQSGCGTSSNPETSNCSPTQGTTYVDTDDPTQSRQWYNFWYLHDWSIYFNRHYQTYGRHVKIIGVDELPPNASDLATYNYDPIHDADNDAANVHPFAVDDQTGALQYNEEMAARHSALSIVQAPASEYQKYPGYMWGFYPNLDRIAQEYADWVCTKVVKPGVTSFAGSFATGTKRTYGVLMDGNEDGNSTDAQQQTQLALQYLKQDCGIVPQDTATAAYCNETVVGGDPSRSANATADMSKFNGDHITTILDPACWDTDHANAANQLGYEPEWLLGADTTHATDGNLDASQEQANEWSHAWVMTDLTYLNADGQGVEPACLEALLEVDPSVPLSGTDPVLACQFYDDLRELFTGIQVAGPHLTPHSMDIGFHAIPDHASTDPQQPSCFYLTGDYTCVKDAIAEWWNPNARPQQANGSNASNGCWEMWAPPGRPSGYRFLPGGWPAGNISYSGQQNDVCNLNPGNASAFERNPPGTPGG